MTKPVSVIEAIVDLLSADPLFTGVLVRFGLLAELPRQRERFYLLGTSNYSREPTTTGHRVRTEDWDVRVLVEVHKLSDDGPEAAMWRMWELIDALDIVLCRDPDLVHAEYTQELVVQADEAVPMTDGWLARALLRIGMETRR